MAIDNPIISAPSIERGRTRVVALPTVYNLPETNPELVSSSISLEYREYSVTNYCQASENFAFGTSDDGAWKTSFTANLSFFTYSINSIVSPIGTLTADRLTSNANYGPVYLRQNFSLGKVSTYTFSLYAKVPSATANLKIAFRTSDYFAGLSTFAETTAALTTQWQRFSLTASTPDTKDFIIELGGPGGWGLGQAIDLWGAQLEESPTVGPYVSTGADPDTLPATQSFAEYAEVSQAPVREGQIVIYRNQSYNKMYVAVDIEGVITWKPCIGIAKYIDPRTGEAPDPNLAFYSSLAA